MKNKILLLLAFMGIASGLFAQNTVWNPAANNPSDGLWTTAENWTNGIPAAEGKAVYNVADAMNCSVNSPVSVKQIVQGDGGPGGTIIVASGGSITTGASWSGIGFNNTAALIVESGGAFTFGEHAWIGMNDGGVADVDIYGTVSVTAMTGIGWNGGTGYVTVYDGGVMNCGQFGGNSIKGASVLDVSGGTVNLTGDKTGDVNTFIEAGGIVAYGGGGTLNVEVVGGNTVITSNPDDTAPTITASLPADGSTDIPVVTNIQIEFSEPMNAASVEAAVTISPDIANKAFDWAGTTLTITGDDMASLLAYTVTVGTGATDANDIALESEYSFGFTTVDPNAPPTVVTTTPADAAIDVDADTDLVINFSKAMDSASVVTSVSAVPALSNPSMAWSTEYKTLTISADRLVWESQYTVTISAGALAADATALAADVVFSFTVKAQALTTIVWSPATDGSSDGMWNTAENWNLNEVANGNYKVVFNVADVPASHVTTAINIHTLVQGDGGPGDTIIVEDGGSITTGAVWSAVGYNAPATLIVETGASFTFGEHAWIALNDGAEGKVHINGGTVNVTGMTGLGWTGGSGMVYVNEGGTMNCAQFNDMSGNASIKDGSLMDISGGTVNLTGDKVSVVKAYIEAGRIVSYSGSGILYVDFANNNTRITSKEEASSDATLSELSVDVGTLDPVFDAATQSYTVLAPEGTTEVVVYATANDAYASISGDGAVDVSSGAGTATIVVTAEDESTLSYTVSITVEETTSIADLQKMEINAYFDASSDLVRIENATSIKTIRLIDLTGKVLINESVRNSESIEISTSTLMDGLYIMQMELSGDNYQVLKFVK